MEVGPVEVLVCTFPGSRVELLFMEALEETAETGSIALIDIVLVQKDHEGYLIFKDLERGLPKRWARMIIDPEPMTLFSEQDLNLIAGFLTTDRCAIAIAVEHRWCRPLNSVSSRAGGKMHIRSRITHADAVKAFQSNGVDAH